MSGSISDNHNAYFFQSILLFVQNTEGNEFGLKKRDTIQRITIMEVEPAKLTWLAEAPPAGSNLQLRICAIDYRRLLDCKSLFQILHARAIQTMELHGRNLLIHC